MKLYSLGKERIEKDFRAEKLIKNLKDIKLVIKSKLYEQDFKFQVEYNNKNVIDLEEEEL